MAEVPAWGLSKFWVRADCPPTVCNCFPTCGVCTFKGALGWFADDLTRFCWGIGDCRDGVLKVNVIPFITSLAAFSTVFVTCCKGVNCNGLPITWVLTFSLVLNNERMGY